MKSVRYQGGPQKIPHAKTCFEDSAGRKFSSKEKNKAEECFEIHDVEIG